MSWRFPAQSTGSHQAGDDAGDGLGHAQAGEYLTDGVELYRSFGVVTSDPCQMIGLENCLSLAVVLIAVDELRRRELRPVIPARHGASGP